MLKLAQLTLRFLAKIFAPQSSFYYEAERKKYWNQYLITKTQHQLRRQYFF